MAKEKKQTDISDKEQKPWLFKKGQSGNPKGRTPGSFSIMNLIKIELNKKADQEGVPLKDRKTYAELFVRRVLNKTIVEGDGPLIKTLIEQIDGAPSRKLELSGAIDTGPAFSEDQMERVAARLLAKRKNK